MRNKHIEGGVQYLISLFSFSISPSTVALGEKNKWTTSCLLAKFKSQNQLLFSMEFKEAVFLTSQYNIISSLTIFNKDRFQDGECIEIFFLTNLKNKIKIVNFFLPF